MARRVKPLHPGPRPDMEVGCRWHPAYGNRLEIIGHAWVDLGHSRQLYCVVRCVCGVEFGVSPTHLRSGNTTSCGCYRRDAARQRMQHLWAKARRAAP